ncbi:MAG: acyltransferase [Muribaculaceae bacterium]|nr:acyltransferase [Muribaculaceae bacterium]
MRSSSLKRYWHMLLMKLAATLPISRQRRAVIFQKAGVSITPNGGVRVGKVTFDSIHPEDVHIDKRSSIADGCILVTHYMDVKNTKETFAYYRGSIHIGRGVYLGSNCIVTKPITIGHGAIISAGSIINKDIPPFEVWGGVPAKFLCKRYESEEQLQQLLKEVEKY